MEAFMPQKDHIKSLRLRPASCTQLVTRCQRLRRAQNRGAKQGLTGSGSDSK
ncbi:hypothetical protein I79_017752 [Cricetulus griseus]|uniref:Uncharacterized protein n=1 Tax=Cricetulus griseus TaxID=10029 RepID=G3I2V8_CRIGR|nr:hypothetical protein I79_017752 [Cricetulus griseus]